MPTIIDSLLVTLGIDASAFSKGEKEANTGLDKLTNNATRTAKEMEARGKQAAQFYSKIKSELISLGVAVLGFEAMKKLVVDTTNSDAALLRLSRNVGVNAKEVAAWAGVVGRFGGTADDASSALKTMSNQMQELELHGSAGTEVYRAMAEAGFNAEQVATYFAKTTTSAERLLIASDVLSKLDQQRAQFIGRGLGYSEGMVNTLMHSRAELEPLLRQYEEMNRLSREGLELSEKRQQAWKDLGAAIAGIFSNEFRKADYWLNRFGSAIERFLGLSKSLARLIPGMPGWDIGEAKPSAPTPAKTDLLALIQKLEGSGVNAESPKGAIGRNQIMPNTAAQYGFDRTRLKEPEYNDQVARAILADLQRRYGDDLDAILTAYNAGPRRANGLRAHGHDRSILPRETQKYLAHKDALVTSGKFAGTGSTSEVSIANVNVYTQATDAGQIAKDIKPALEQYIFTAQAAGGLN